MRRRHVLQAVGVVASAALGGCGLFDDSTGGNDGDPFEATPADLLPPVSVLEDAIDAPLESRSEIETGIVRRAQARAAYRVADAESAIPDVVEVGAWVFDDVDAARSNYEDLPYHEGWNMGPSDVAVEALAGVVDSEREYRTVFRDANAMGALAYRNPHTGNAEQMRRVGYDLAVAMHGSWRE